MIPTEPHLSSPAPYGVIADDFTGAADVAGLLARSGASVALHTLLPTAETLRAQAGARAHVIALKIRTIAPENAVSQALDALHALQAVGVERFYWKYCSTFDSTPRGNIGPVAEALMRALDTPFTLYCPAFPENGRTVVNGNLYVNGVPLADSPMKDHPLTPMRDSNLVSLLLPQITGLAARLIGLGSLRIRAETLAREGIAHLIPDVASQTKIEALGRDFGDQPLLTGASPLAAAASGLGTGSPAPHPTLPTHVRNGPALILSGSCSQATRAQVAAFVDTGAPVFWVDPIEIARDGPGALIERLCQQLGASPVLLCATAEPAQLQAIQSRMGVETSSRVVEETLATAATAARARGASRFVVAGGETSGAVAMALGATSLRVRNEIAPGVPWCLGSDAAGDFALTMKSGNFGADSFFTDALDTL